MTDIYLGEKGKTIYINTNHDLSSAFGVEIHFSAPDGSASFINSASCSVLAANLTISAAGIYSANKTVEYVINSGDFSGSANAGTWKGWLQCDFTNGARLISSSFRFTVSNPG